LVLFFSLSFGDTKSVVVYLPRIFPYICSMQKDPDEEISRLARHTSALIAQTNFHPSLFPKLLEDFQIILQNPLWNVRSAVLPVLQIIAFNHRFHLNSEQLKQIYDLTIHQFSDNQIEIRELARIALISLIKSTQENVPELAEKFKKLAPIQNKRNRKKESIINLVERHGGVLGIAALIESRPYDVPEWMPELLMTLSKYSSESSPIQETVRNTFAEFWR